MSEHNQQSIQNDEISLRDLILLIQKYFNLLLKSWWIIGLSTILFAGLFFYRASKNTTTYTASLSYTASESSGLSGLAGGLVGRFLGGGRKSDPITKAQSMTSTRKIAQMVLFSKVTIDGKYDYIINHHGNIYEVKDFKPFTDDKLSTVEERSLLLNIIKMINGIMMSQSYNDESGMATLSMTSPSEEYAIELSKQYFQSLVEFYTDTEIGAQQRTLEALEFRADSIYNAIQSTAYRIARIKDEDKGIFRSVDKVPEAQATTELTFLGAAYEEIVKNLETIKFTVASNAPSFRVIDYPVTPIKPNSRGRLRGIIIGGLLGGFLASFIILARSIFREIMTKDEDTEIEMI